LVTKGSEKSLAVDARQLPCLAALRDNFHLEYLLAMVLFTRAFFYQPLDENIGEIRLLRLLRRHDSRLPFLRRSRLCEAECETRHFRLGHAPRYTALSYCWGSPSERTLSHSTMAAYPLLEISLNT
jgi:hypothetical protein